MAITTIDGVVAGMLPPIGVYKTGPAAKAVGAWISYWSAAGFPGSAGAVATLSSGMALTASVTGQVPFKNPTSGNTYLARWVACQTQTGMPVLCDRLWHNGNISPSTTATQSWTPAAIPPRDINGASEGCGVMVGLEYGVAAQNAATNAGILYYTNCSGTSGRIASWTGIASALLAQFIPCTLQAGDKGVRSVQGILLQVSNTSASINIVLYRPIAYLPNPLANVGQAVDPVTGGFPRFYDNSVPFIIAQAGATTAPVLAGNVVYTQG